MPDYRRYFVPGGSYFFTIVTYRRKHIFADKGNVELLRAALLKVKNEMQFEINAAVILPDHMHFIWTLPPGDCDYSKRIGRLKVEFTRSLCGPGPSRTVKSPSRCKHRDSDVWQRRFWEHLIRDDHDFDRHFDYIHYNPVKHGFVRCPHEWEPSSFHYWVSKGVLERGWGCHCSGKYLVPLDFSDIEDTVGE